MVETAWALKEHLKRYGNPTPKIVICECKISLMLILLNILSNSWAPAPCSDCFDALECQASLHLQALLECKRRRLRMFPDIAHWSTDTHRCMKQGIWWLAGAHNSHLGDARATDMGLTRGEVNVGHLLRERCGDSHPDCVANLGFTTHSGTVAAADDWDDPVQNMRVNPSLPG